MSEISRHSFLDCSKSRQLNTKPLLHFLPEENQTNFVTAVSPTDSISTSVLFWIRTLSVPIIPNIMPISFLVLGLCHLEWTVLEFRHTETITIFFLVLGPCHLEWTDLEFRPTQTITNFTDKYFAYSVIRYFQSLLCFTSGLSELRVTTLSELWFTSVCSELHM